MRKYKINRDKERRLPPHAVSDKFKDFDKIRMQHSDITKRPDVPLYKNKKLFMLLILIAVVAWVVSESIKEEKEIQDRKDKIELKEKNKSDSTKSDSIH